MKCDNFSTEVKIAVENSFVGNLDISGAFSCNLFEIWSINEDKKLDALKWIEYHENSTVFI